MKYDNDELCNKFLNSLKGHLKFFYAQDGVDFIRRLKNRSETTKFYKEELFEAIASDLGFINEVKEYLRVDAMLYDKGSDKRFHVPIVFIESENDGNDQVEGHIQNEVFKLCSLNAPLKVLFTKNWYEPDTKQKNDWWDYVLDDFVEFNRLVGYFIVITVDWINKDQLRFHCLVYNEYGKRIKEDSLDFLSFQINQLL